MNIAAAVAREYLKQVARPRIWPAYVARLVEANLSLMGQRIMALIRKIERGGTLVDGNNIQGRYTRSRSRRLSNDGSTRTICDLGILPPSGTRKIPLRYFRDALATCAVSAGEFVLRVNEQSIISTDRYSSATRAFREFALTSANWAAL